MIITVDAGNTFTKWKVYGDVETEGGRFHNIDGLSDFIAWLEPQVPEKIMLASVVDNEIKQSLEQVFTSEKVQAVSSTGSCLGVTNCYSRPERLGIDRWLAAIEAWHLSEKRACCIFDIGTAATLDIVDGDGRHVGGHIVPGLAMMAKVLQQETQKVRYDALNIREGGYGKNTGEAVERGVWSMLLAWMTQEIAAFYERFPDGSVFLTGGAAGQFMERLSDAVVWHEDLVLDAMYRIAVS